MFGRAFAIFCRRVVLLLMVCSTGTPIPSDTVTYSAGTFSDPWRDALSFDAPSATISTTLSWEAHGRDDIREWRAGFLKGNTYIKVDLNFQSESFCQQQVNQSVPSSLLHHFLLKSSNYRLETGTESDGSWLLYDCAHGTRIFSY